LSPQVYILFVVLDKSSY